MHHITNHLISKSLNPMHGDPNSSMHNTQPLTQTRKGGKKFKSLIAIETLRKLGTRSNLELATATARGGSRASTASASPPSGSPARPNTKGTQNIQIRSARGGIQSNRTQKPQPRIKSRINPTPTCGQPTYPLLLRVARGGRRCGRCGVAVSHLCGERG